ncbi:MAG: GNAT family protein [Nanoarchaeota archaeon]|nr:GNAT family protein [Nanoarchaeota archaeon]
MKIETKRLVIRDLEMKDVNYLVDGCNNLNVSRYLALVPYPYSEKSAKDFIKTCVKESKEKPRTKYNFGIELKEENRIVGSVGLSKVDYFQGTATVGYWINEDYWRRGIMSEALEAVINFAFRKLKLRRINVKAFSENKASNSLIKKAGFVYEGTCRKSVKDKALGKIHDNHIYGMLKDDWNKEIS